MKIRLDRTICDGFGTCAIRAPRHFSLDDWGYASLAGNGGAAPGDVTPEDEPAVTRALLDCPAHAITVLSDPWLLGAGHSAAAKAGPAAERGR